MADNSFSQNQWPEGNKNEGAKPNVDVRTYSSDVKSVADSGGGAPKPYVPETPPPAPKMPEPAAPSPIVKSEPKQTFNEVFPSVSQGGQEAAPAPMNLDSGNMANMATEGMKPKKSSKGLFMGILAVIIIAGLIALGYFFVYPIFFGGEVEEVAEVPVAPAAEVPAEPSVPTVPEVPTVTEGESEVEATVPAEESEIPSVPAASLVHSSLFKSAADATADVTLAELSVSAYQSSMEFTTAEVPVLKELVFKKGGGDVATFNDIAGILLPGLFAADLNQSFEEDFTFFTYTDSKGTWPGFVAKLKEGSTLADVQTEVANLESSGNLANLYLSSPGSQTSWKSGSVEGISTRYLPFSLSGASLNYGWSGNMLVVGTSFPGFQESAKRLK